MQKGLKSAKGITNFDGVTKCDVTNVRAQIKTRARFLALELIQKVSIKIIRSIKNMKRFSINTWRYIKRGKSKK